MSSHRLIVVTLAWALAAPLAAQAHRPAPPGLGQHGAAQLALGSGRIDRACAGHACMSALDYRTQLRRELRFMELREGSARPLPEAPSLPRADLRPPTPEGHIQPAYRGASQIRPEFNQPQDLRERPAQP